MIDSEDRREMVKALVATLVPEASAHENGLANAIRTELLLTALQDSAHPRTIYDLWRVLRRMAAGDVAAELVAAVERRVATEPDRLLTDLAC